MTCLTRLIALLAIAIGVAASQAVWAHEDFRFEEMAGDKIARLTINGDELEANDLLDFSFGLSDAKGDVDFATVGVRIALKGRGLLFSTLIYANSGRAFMSYTFPTGGEYEIIVGYSQNNTPVAEAAFTVNVDPLVAAPRP